MRVGVKAVDETPQAVGVHRTTADALAAGWPAIDGKPLNAVGGPAHVAAEDREMHVRSCGEACVAHVAEVTAFADPPACRYHGSRVHVGDSVAIPPSTASVATFADDLVAIAVTSVARVHDPAARR